MGLSVYVHIPYCLQRCRYCDFTTFEWSEILPPEKYVEQVLQEIRNRHHLWQDREIATLYFGGGTPSLIAPELIVAITTELANVGFKFLPESELTLEINPATIREESLDVYQSAGFNRFSVGAQSFDDGLLALCGRKHNAADTRHTIKLLKNRNVNYSFDLLFALPSQTLQQLNKDLDEVLQVEPPHLSAYCLTVPETHPMALGRPPEDEQVEMFDLIERRLKEIGILKYEISNFARPGFESKHNLTYWQDRNYWGIGLSAHSYGANHGAFGTRFWNPKKLDIYAQQSNVKGTSFSTLLPAEQWEELKDNESLTDFCHMHLRIMTGLHESALRKKFSAPLLSGLWARLAKLTDDGLLRHQSGVWSLTQRGCLISNQVFEKLTFLQQERALT